MGVSEDMQQRQKLQSLDITDELLDGIFPTDIPRSRKSTTEKKEHLTINIYKTEDSKQQCSNCIEWNSNLVSIALLYTNYHISFLCILILSCLYFDNLTTVSVYVSYCVLSLLSNISRYYL